MNRNPRRVKLCWAHIGTGGKGYFGVIVLKDKKEGISRLLEIAGGKKSYLSGSIILSVIGTLFQFVPYICVYIIVNELINSNGDVRMIDSSRIWTLAWTAFASTGLFGVFLYCGSMLSHIAAFKILREIRVKIASKLSRIYMGFFSENTTGSVKKVMTEDVEKIELFVAHHIPDIACGIALPLITITVLFFFDWRLALATLLPLPFAFLAQMKMMSSKTAKECQKVYHNSLGRMNSTIVEYVRGMPVIKVFNLTGNAYKKFTNAVISYRDLTFKWIEICKNSYIGFVTLVGSSLIFVLPIGTLILTGSGSYNQYLSVFFLFLILGSGIAVPLFKLMMLGGLINQIGEGVRRIDSILDLDEIKDTRQNLTVSDHSVEFKNVSFAYEKTDVLKNVSFKIPQGSITALVGPSGSGKSTIANLLIRLWDSQSGEILIGGKNITQMPLSQLNDIVSYVFQDTFMFFDTIENNIRMGNDRATREDVVKAAKAAQIHDFIMSLPEKYDTFIGEKGIYLSGGEQQRVSIARTILKDSPIVILDEATAFADPENETRIQKAFSKLLQEKTVIIIAHRLSTITDVDNILLIDKGEVAESGRHDDLLKLNGKYTAMWKAHIDAVGWNLEGERVNQNV